MQVAMEQRVYNGETDGISIVPSVPLQCHHIKHTNSYRVISNDIIFTYN